MAFTLDQSQMRFLSLALPALTLSIHTLLALSFTIPASNIDLERAFYSATYNVFAAGASVLGLVGAVKSIPSLVSTYTLVHIITLLFVNVALVDIVTPFDFTFLNPVVPNWPIDEAAICGDIASGWGWDDEWLLECSKSFSMVRFCVACIGLPLLISQWWALMAVRKWSREMRLERRRAAIDVENNGSLHRAHGRSSMEKPREKQ